MVQGIGEALDKLLPFRKAGQSTASYRGRDFVDMPISHGPGDGFATFCSGASSAATGMAFIACAVAGIFMWAFAGGTASTAGMYMALVGGGFEGVVLIILTSGLSSLGMKSCKRCNSGQEYDLTN